MTNPESHLSTEPRSFDPDPPPETLTRQLLSHLPGMAYRCRLDAEWTMEFVSQGSRQLTGFDPDDLKDNQVVSFGALIHPGDRERVEVAVREAVAQGRPFRLTYRIRRADGRQRWVWEQGSAIRGPGGQVEALEGFITDITDRKELAERAESADRLFRALTEQSHAGVFVLKDGRIDYANPRLITLLGLDPGKLNGRPSLRGLAREEDRAMIRDRIADLRTGESEVTRFEFTAMLRGGIERRLQVQLNTVEVDGRSALLGTALDVTERRRAERRYHEAQKMESLGRLAGGIAHDFNNILATIDLSAHLLRESLTLDAEAAEDLETIREAVLRGTALSRQLMTFGRTDAPDARVVQVPEVIANVVPMLDRLTGPDIEITLRTQPALPTIEIAPAHVEQILMNLVINARDAMPSGGRIDVDVHVVPHGPPSAPSAHRSSPQVVLMVEDEGTGIDPEFLPHLFEPYFTTKGDKGTGLGLGNVWRIAAEAGGCVTVESELDEGSTFSVYLPVDA